VKFGVELSDNEIDRLSELPLPGTVKLNAAPAVPLTTNVGCAYAWGEAARSSDEKAMTIASL